MANEVKETVTLKKNSEKVLLDYAELRKAFLVLRAINHKLRRRMIDILSGFKCLTVTQIYIKLRLEQSVASQHLGILRRAGFVLTNRRGKFIDYSVNQERLGYVSMLVEDLAG